MCVNLTFATRFLLLLLVVGGSAQAADNITNNFSLFHFVYDAICATDSTYTMPAGLTGVCNLPYTQRDASMLFLSDIFGNVGGALAGGSNQLLGRMFGIFNSGILILVSLFASYIILTGVINTARDGTFMGQQKGGFFLIFRTILGVALVVPRTSGYCIMQIIIMYVVITGIQFANLLWGFAEIYYASNGNSLLPSSLISYSESDKPAVQAYSEFLKTEINTEKNRLALSKSIANLFGSAICQQYYYYVTIEAGDLPPAPFTIGGNSFTDKIITWYPTLSTNLKNNPFLEVLDFYHSGNANCGTYFLGNIKEFPDNSDIKEQVETSTYQRDVSDQRASLTYGTSKKLLSDIYTALLGALVMIGTDTHNVTNSYSSAGVCNSSNPINCYTELLKSCFTSESNTEMCVALMARLDRQVPIMFATAFAQTESFVEAYNNLYANQSVNDSPVIISGGWALAGSLFSFGEDTVSSNNGSFAIPKAYINPENISAGQDVTMHEGHPIAKFNTWRSSSASEVWYTSLESITDPSLSADTACPDPVNLNGRYYLYGTLEKYFYCHLTDFFTVRSFSEELDLPTDGSKMGDLYTGLLGSTGGGLGVFENTQELKDENLSSYINFQSFMAWVPFNFFTQLDGFEYGPIKTLTTRWQNYQKFILNSWFIHFSQATTNARSADINIMDNPFQAIQQFGVKLIAGGISFIVYGVNDIVVNFVKTFSVFKSLMMTYFFFMMTGELFQFIIHTVMVAVVGPEVGPFSVGMMLQWLAMPPIIGPLIRIILHVTLFIVAAIPKVLTAFAPTILPVLSSYYHILLFQKTLYVPLFSAAVAPFLLIGALFAIYVPLLPMLIYSLTFVNWVICVFELMIAAPLVALGIAYPTGHDLLGSSSKMMTLLITALIRPPAIVIGYIMAIILAFIGILFFSYLTSAVILETLSAFSVFSVDTTGATVASDLQSLSAVQQISLMAILLLYCYILLTVLSACFSYIYLLPYTITRWLDPSSAEGNQAEAEEIQDIMGSFTSLIGRATDAGGQYMSSSEFQMDPTASSHKLQQAGKAGSGKKTSGADEDKLLSG